MDAIVSFFSFPFFLLIFPGTCCSSSTTNLLSLKASFTTPLAPAVGALLPKHTGFNQVFWLGVPAQTPVNHTSLANWSPGIPLQTALAEPSSQTLLLCKGKVGWWLSRVYSRSQAVSGVWNSPFRSLQLIGEHHSSASGTWWEILISRCRTEKASMYSIGLRPLSHLLKADIYFWICLCQATLFPSFKGCHSQVVGALESNLVFAQHILHKLQTLSRARNLHFI